MNYNVRIQSNLGFERAKRKLWYLLRGLDVDGSGRVQYEIEAILAITGRKFSTLMQWLQQAKESKDIRDWSSKRGVLTVFYSSRANVCKRSHIYDWGASADVPLVDAAQRLKTISLQMEVQALQERSHFAAKKAIKGNQRKFVRVYAGNELLELVGVRATSTPLTTFYNATVPGFCTVATRNYL